MNKQINIIDISGTGFEKLVSLENTQIAVLTYLDELELNNINYLEAHLLTDEIFILLEGRCTIISGLVENDKINDYHLINLEKDKLYVVKQNVFHHHVLSKDAKVLVIEKKGTNYHNSKRIYFTKHNKEKLTEAFS